MSSLLYSICGDAAAIWWRSQVRVYTEYKTCALRGKKHTYNIKELSEHYITEETCMCVLGQREKQYSSGEQFRSFKTV